MLGGRKLDDRAVMLGSPLLDRFLRSSCSLLENAKRHDKPEIPEADMHSPIPDLVFRNLTNKRRQTSAIGHTRLAPAARAVSDGRREGVTKTLPSIVSGTRPRAGRGVGYESRRSARIERLCSPAPHTFTQGD